MLIIVIGKKIEFSKKKHTDIPGFYSNPKSVSITGSRRNAWESMSRGSASPEKIEAEPPDLRYQAEPGNE